jgi:hypothetical protein
MADPASVELIDLVDFSKHFQAYIGKCFGVLVAHASQDM